jgi:hypothetical protein
MALVNLNQPPLRLPVEKDCFDITIAVQFLRHRSNGSRPVTNILSCVALTLFIPASSWAAADTARSCVRKATEALPKVAGLQVKKSGIRSMPPQQLANWKGQSRPIIVDLDTDAPGASERYSYICASSRTGSAFVQRILE